jgi:hypothetical protein
MLVVNPCGFTEPFRLAEKLAIKVAGLVMATGGPVTGGGVGVGVGVAIVTITWPTSLYGGTLQ